MMPIPQKKAHEFQTDEREEPTVDPPSSSRAAPVQNVSSPLDQEAPTSRRKERLRKPPEDFRTMEVPEDTAFLNFPEHTTPLRAKRYRGRGWFFFWLGLSGIGFVLVVGVEIYTNFWVLYADQPFIGLVFLLGWLLVGGGIALWLLRTWRRFQRLKTNTSAKELFRQADNAASSVALTEWLQAYFHERWVQGIISHEHYNKTKIWLHRPVFYREQEAIAEAFAPLDEAAREKIAEVALAAGIATAISQRGWLDMLLILGKGCYLVPAIAEIYGVRPGSLITLTLFWKSLRNGLFAGIFDTAGDNLAILVTKASGDIPLVGAAANMTTQGLVNSVLVCRLGMACMQECRPAPLDRSSLLSMYSALFREKVTFQKIYTLLKAKEVSHADVKR